MQWFFCLTPPLQALLASLFMCALTALGAAFVFFSRRVGKGMLTLLTGGAAGIMLSASIFSLLLPALEGESFLPAYLTTTLGFLLGGVFVLGGDLFFSRRSALRLFGERENALLYFAVTLHNLPEGMAVGVAFAALGISEGGALSALLLAVGIAMQNFPEGMCVAFPLRAKGMSPTKSFLFSLSSGAVEIPACLLGVFAAGLIGGLLPWALAFSAGAMIAVISSELLPECFSGNKTAAGIGVLLGFALMMVLDVALG